ncbi:dolichyl-phosphate-mannose--protein mannosyltransferase [Microbacterium indicum]|uniref:dolichyl-phosphate-mannose--protein mannosyltransferase n=1 Tax=Microbacterium indicum TaxID=358100 RepID=UPI00040447A4|nr:phospholipid carrier-dependent glycosyltransferase [Microbacterium indicum]
MIERLTSERAARIASWAVPVAVTAVAAATRIIGVGGPHELIFDETYYVKDAWTLLHLGYEAQWGDDPNPAFESGATGGYTAEGSFVAHPPLGKWIIAIGMMIFGGDSTFGWRIMTALVGTALVPLLYVVAKRLTRSVPMAGIAALLLAIDPLAISMSRVALLDTHLAFFILLGFWFALIDRHETIERIRRGAVADRIAGPVVWRRPWLIAAGVSMGLASGVKWSGLYALAVLGIAVVVADAVDRRRAGVDRWVEAAIGRQGPASFVLLVPPAIVAYVVTWTGWLVTSGGYARDSKSNAFAALLEYHRQILQFHESVQSPHTYASPAWEWIPMLNPTLMYREASDGQVGLMAALPNPILWWVGVLVVVWFAVRLVVSVVRRTEIIGREAFVLVGVAATYIPWLALPKRTMFSFYAITLLPFVIVGVVIALQNMRRPVRPVLLDDPTEAEIAVATARATTATDARRTVASIAVVVFVVVGLFFLPYGTGLMEPEALYRAHLWLPSWFL